MMRKNIFFIATAAILLFACHPSKPIASTQSVIKVYLNLIELNDHVIDPGNFSKSPFLVLYKEEGMSGNAGCNNFFGRYSFTGKNEIRFSDIGSTKMACQNMEGEREFLKALQQTISYSIKTKFLIFYDSNGKPVAKFETGNEYNVRTSEMPAN